MIRGVLGAFLFVLVLSGNASAQTCTVPVTLMNGNNADASQVMTNLNALATCINNLATNTGALRGYVSGLTLSTLGSSTNFAVAAGVATSDTTSTPMVSMTLATSLAKTTAAWAVGSGTGSLDTGTIANNTWYHVFLIRSDTGVVDVLVSRSPTTPTLPTGYGKQRRIGSIKTDGSGQWVKFIQVGNTFYWDVPTGDVTVANPGTAAVLRLISVPPDVVVEAILTVLASGTNPSTDSPLAIYISNPAVSDTAPGNSVNNFYVNSLATTTFGLGGTLRVFTNTVQQVRSRVLQSTSGTILIINTQGWVDRRGSDG